MRALLPATTALLAAAAAKSAPVEYTIDPSHTVPSFEVPHLQGISIFRGRFDKTTGAVTLDREARTGSLDVLIDASSIDFADALLTKNVQSEDMLHVAKYPTITYKSTKFKFDGSGKPTEIEGELTLHGVTRPVTLIVNSFKCIINPTLKKEVCGADAGGTFNRADFGIDFAIQMTGSPLVKLAIQVEAIRSDSPAR